MSDHSPSSNEVPIEHLVDPADDPTAGPEALDRLVSRAAALGGFMSDEDDGPEFRLVFRPER